GNGLGAKRNRNAPQIHDRGAARRRCHFYAFPLAQSRHFLYHALVGDGSPPKLEMMTMKLLTLTLGAVLFTLAVVPAADAKIVPPWIVVRWAYGDCKIWRNDINGPAG